MNLILPNILFVILIAILTGFLTFLTTKGGLTDNRSKGVWNKLTSRGKRVFFVLLAIFLILVGQEYNNNNSSKQKDSLLKVEQTQRDSIIAKSVAYATDSINKKYYNDISIAFSKQEYKLDTLNQAIVKIKDNSSINNYIQASPVIFLDSTAVILKKKIGPLYKYELTITVKDAGATNFNIKCKILVEFIKNSYALTNVDLFPDNIKLFKNSLWITGFSFSDPEKRASNVYLYLRGTYTSIDGLKPYPINDLYCYNLSTRIITVPMNIHRKEIIKIINKLPENGEIIKM